MTGAATSSAPDLFTATPASQPPRNQWIGGNPDRVIFIRARVGWPDGGEKTFRGRFAQTLARLLHAGRSGITSLDHPGTRLSHYVYRLRRDGLLIVMHDERHGGPFAGSHGRYELRTPVVVLETREAQP